MTHPTPERAPDNDQARYAHLPDGPIGYVDPMGREFDAQGNFIGWDEDMIKAKREALPEAQRNQFDLEMAMFRMRENVKLGDRGSVTQLGKPEEPKGILLSGVEGLNKAGQTFKYEPKKREIAKLWAFNDIELALDNFGDLWYFECDVWRLLEPQFNPPPLPQEGYPLQEG